METRPFSPPLLGPGNEASIIGYFATTTQRKALVRETGVTGESILYRLHRLCGFNPIKDSVIDAMHVVVLNLVRTEIEKHLPCDIGQ